jgi:hypothetical protein
VQGFVQLVQQGLTGEECYLALEGQLNQPARYAGPEKCRNQYIGITSTSLTNSGPPCGRCARR